MSRYGSPSRVVEDQFEEAVNAAEASLSALDKIKRSARATEEARQSYIEAKQVLSPELYQQPFRRSSSAPRGVSGAQGNRNVAFEPSQGLYEQKPEEPSMERRFEAFLRKQKLMEERLKRLENQKAIDAQNAVTLQEERDRLMEDQKADRKVIQSLRSQVSSLKAKVDMVTNTTEEERERRPSASIDFDTADSSQMKALINAAVQAEMQRAVNDITAKVLREQAANPLNRSQLSDSKIFARSAGVEQFSSLEKETIRLSSDFDRLKTRQTTLESAYAELRNTSTVREMKAEEAHKRSINAHRVEVESFLASAARRTADSLATVQNHGQELQALRSDLDGFVDRSGSALAELDMRISFHDQSKEEVYSVLERVEGDAIQLKNQSAEAEASLVRLMEDSLKLAKVSGTVDGLSRQLSVLTERVGAIDMQLQATASSVDAQAVPIDLLAKSIDGINEKFESRTDILRQSIDANKADAEGAVAGLGEAMKKTKGRVKELAESFKGVSQIRQSIEAVLREVDSRAKQDASWTYSFKTALQKVEGRVQAVEHALVHPSDHTGDANPDIGVSTTSAAAAGAAVSGGAVGGGAVAMLPASSAAHSLHLRGVPLLGTQFDEIRALIGDLRQQLLQAGQSDCARLREEMVALLGEHNGTLEDRCAGLVESRGKRCDDYIEQQLQGNLDYMNDRLQELKESILDVQVLQDQTLSEQDELRGALGGRLSAAEQHIQVLRDTAETLGQSVSAVGEIVPRVVGELTGRLSGVEEAWSERIRGVTDDLSERFRVLEDGASQAAVESAEHTRESVAELREQLGGLTERIALQEDHTVESSAQLKTHISLIDELHTSLGQCQTILEGQEERMNDLGEDLENQRTALQETAELLSAQVREASESFAEQCRLLQDDVHTLKQDLTSHANFTNDSLGDLHEALQAEIAAVKETALEVAARTDTLQAGHAELRTATAEENVKLRALFTELDVKVTQGHTLLERSITDLEHSLATIDAGAKDRATDLEHALASIDSASQGRVTELEHALAAVEAGGKSRMAGTEKRLASQEAAMKERVVRLEVKLGGLEESLRTKVAVMEGSLASQEEQLKDSVSIELKLAQDAALHQRFAEVSDALRAEVIAVKERLSEVESRMAAQEGELSNATAELQQELRSLQERAEAATRAQQTANAEALRVSSEELLQTVDHRNAGLRDLIFQIHELLNAHNEAAAQSADQVAAQIAAVEESIQSTDALLSEHVNAVQHELEFLREDSKTYALAEHVTSKLAELKGNLAEETSAISAEVKAASDKIALFEDECSRRIAEVELKASANQASVKLKLVELEGRVDQQDNAVDAALIASAGERQEEQETILERVRELEGRLESISGELVQEVRNSETALLGKIGDSSQLMQMQEKRLRAVEKSVDAKHADTVAANADLRAFATERMTALADGIALHASSTKETVSALAMQLVALQGQMNDHTDEVRNALESEISALKAQVSSEISEYSASAPGARVEEWVNDLQRAHDDHTDRVTSAAQQTEERLQTLEGTLAGLQGILTSARVDAPTPAPDHSSTSTALASAAAAAATASMNLAIDRVRSELATVETSTKQRLTALEQRLVRQEAQSREKSADLAEALSKQSITLFTRVGDVEGRLNKMENEQTDTDRVLDQFDELKEEMSNRTHATDAKLQELQSTLTEQIRALQPPRQPVPPSEMKKAPEAGGNVSRPRSAPASAHRPLPRTSSSAPSVAQDVRHSSGYTAQEMHDISRVSQISISPVNKHQDSGEVDIFEQRCELTLTEDYSPLDDGEAGNAYGNRNRDKRQSLIQEDDGYDDFDDFEEERLVADMAHMSLSHGKDGQDRRRAQTKQEGEDRRDQEDQRRAQVRQEGEDRRDQEDRRHQQQEAHHQRPHQQRHEQSQLVRSQGQQQQERPHRYAPGVSAQRVRYAEDDFEEDEFEEEGAGALSEFNSMMETVNFDIVALGSHLKAFKPGAEAEQKQASQEELQRQNEERQAAVESLQLKKFNHRRKFQGALFNHK